MREIIQHQMPLVPCSIDHEHATELDAISQILDSLPEAVTLVYDDLVRFCDYPDQGRESMTGEQVLRAIVVKQMPDTATYSRRIADLLDAAGVELVIQAGFLSLWHVPPQYEGRVMNIHPALLPGFGGHGMFGHHVHEAVLAAGCKVSGCTVHFVTNEYDAGPIIVQRCVPVLESDTPDSLADRVFEQECVAYPEAIRLFAEGRLRIEDRAVRIAP